MFSSESRSDDESEDRTPLSKKTKDIQSQGATLPKEKPIIDVSDSSKSKKRSAEDDEPSSSKKQKVTRKGKTAPKPVDSDDIDDIIEEIDL